VTGAQLATIAAACITGQAFFAGAEIAIGTSSRVRLRQQAQAGKQGAKSAEGLAAKPQVLLSTTLIGVNLATVIVAVCAAIYVKERGWSGVWVIPVLLVAMLVLGQLVPKTLMQAQSDRIVRWVAPPLRLISLLIMPVGLVVSGFAGAMTRLVGTDRKKVFVTRDELAMLIESEPESDKPGITADEREMIANVLELSDYDVADLMVPLSEVTALPEDTNLHDAALEIQDKQHSRMPVYRSRVDDIVGIVHLFDVLKFVGTDAKSKNVGEVAHPATYVPQSMKAIDLLVALQAEGNHIAVVVDEYGGAVGIVTFEDLLETIVGDIDDEYDVEPSPIKQERPGVWRVEAKTSVARINQELDVGLPESDDYETIAGLLIEHMRHIPERGAILTLGTVTIEVIAATDRAIELVRIARKKK
jgi:putative hemolysin